MRLSTRWLTDKNIPSSIGCYVKYDNVDLTKHFAIIGVSVSFAAVYMFSYNETF